MVFQVFDDTGHQAFLVRAMLPVILEDDIALVLIAQGSRYV
jgi:hypothetical protein